MKNMEVSVSIYNYIDYRSYVSKVISKAIPARGTLSRIAKEAGCQASYLSQVLQDKAHLSADQAFGIASFLKLNDDETEYFLGTLNYAKASTPKLRSRIKSQLEALKVKAQAVARVIDREDRILPEVDHAFYYSSWIVAAIHVCTDISSLQNPMAIATYLQISTDLVLKTLLRLENLGLVRREGLKWVHSGRQSHVDKQSPYFRAHLDNWHHQASLASQLQRPEAVQFSGIYAISESAFHEMKAGMLQSLKFANHLAAESSSERVVCINLDFFWLR